MYLHYCSIVSVILLNLRLNYFTFWEITKHFTSKNYNHCLTFNSRIQWIIIVFFLFQTPKDFRRLLLFIDPSLNTPITEQSYGDHCAIYDENNPEDPYHNIKGNYRLFYGYYTPWLRLVSFSSSMRMIFHFISMASFESWIL